MTGPGAPQQARGEQSRARYPDQTGSVERDGVRIFYEVYGSGDRTVLLVPPWAVVHSRIFKMQIPYLARHCRVLTFDPRGNGRSERPSDRSAYTEREYAADALAVLDATGTDRAVLVGVSLGAQRCLLLAAEHPERVSGLALISPSLPLGPAGERAAYSFTDERADYEGWAKFNEHYWRRDYPGFLEFFMAKCFSEPHSTKGREDAVAWGLETDAETLVTLSSATPLTPDELRQACSQVTCPVLVLHGDADEVSPHGRGVALAEATGGRLITLHGGGHLPLARDPVQVNLALRDFVAPPPPRSSWARGRSRPRKALFISSPIGLGHAQRDVAIADELRALHPDLHIDWLAQDPVTRVLAAHGERIHPASRFLASESAHIESEAGEHDLHAFQAIRRMDEILVNNFMVFSDVVRDDDYDLWIGDEAWELDYYLHENPEQKRAAYAWLTDFVGWLPMPDGGRRERLVTADYNAEMIAQIARYPRVRDRALFVGNPGDVVADSFGEGLPLIREWTEAHYDFPGYVTGFDPQSLGDRDALRADLGYRPGEEVCVVTVGGSGVGTDLLRRIVDAFPAARRAVPALRMVVVCGPRIDPERFPSAEGLEVRAYVPQLYRHLAACDLAVVQGGLTTTMELTAGQRPFLYFPLRHHFEQNFHVRHRLDRHGAGRCMDYDTTDPETLAAAIVQALDRPVAYRAVETDGAARAAALLAELL